MSICSNCNGHGLVAQDFTGEPTHCNKCGGSGRLTRNYKVSLKQFIKNFSQHTPDMSIDNMKKIYEILKDDQNV